MDGEATDGVEEAEVRGRRGRIGVAALLAGGVAGAALLAGWVERKPIVAHFVDRELGAAHVPASYRLVAIGPFTQRLEDVRIGDPAHPDLTAKSVEIDLRYGLDGPSLGAVRAEGVRLHAQLVDGRVSLGAIDRLLPKSSGNGPIALPDLSLSLADARVALATPAGPIGATITGRGNLANGFRGTLKATSMRLDVAGCAIAAPLADVAIRIDDRRPHVTGPIGLAGLSCAGVAAGAGKAVLDLRFAPSLDHWDGAIGLDGFAGSGGGVRFGPLGGRITMAGGPARIAGHSDVSVAGATGPGGHADRVALVGNYRFVPGAGGLIYAGDVRLAGAAVDVARRRAWLGAAGSLGATPVGPLAAQVATALDRLLAGSDADARVAFTAGGQAGAGLRIRRLDLVARQGGGRVRIDEGNGFGWQARDRAWRFDGRIRTGGGGLPAADIALRQAKAGGPVSGVATLAPYAAPDARLALTPVRFRISGAVTRFDTVATLDGPLGSGRIEGLSLSVSGRIDGGGLRIGEGCVTAAFQRLALSGMLLDPARIGLCGVNGAPILARSGQGPVRFGMVADHIALAGRSGSAPLVLATGHARVDQAGFALDAVSARLGVAEPRTGLDLGHVEGTFGTAGLAGRFADGSGRIGAVPLLFSGVGGDWTLANGTLGVKGGLGVADAAEVPRFAPLVSRDVQLALKDGWIAATGSLIEPKTGAKVSDIGLHHDLATGRGGATLAVPGLVFADKTLQPEMLTPLTLGVIANVAGTITGNGRIDWTQDGTTSSGDFGTEGIDLAAAFGPVRKIVGRIHFTDLLGLVTPPRQEATIAEVNPGIVVSNGVVHYELLAGQRVKVEDARWPFADGELILEPTVLDFDVHAQRHLTFRVKGLDAAGFVQQLAFPNISATGTFDGVLPMIFDQTGGRIEGGLLVARASGGGIAYVGELTNAQLGAMGKLAFDALKKIRYRSLSINLDGRLDGEIVSRVNFDGVRQDTGDSSLAARLIRNLPFRFNIRISAPFRGLFGSARAFADPSILLSNGQAIPVQTPDSEAVR